MRYFEEKSIHKMGSVKGSTNRQLPTVLQRDVYDSNANIA